MNYNNWRDKIEEMLLLQNRMNLKVNTSWALKDYPWYRAACVEASEMIDHLGYKWWKHQEPNIYQAKLELVDIWHFCLSDLMVKGLDIKDIYNIVESMLKKSVTPFEVNSSNLNLLITDIERFQLESLESESCALTYIFPILSRLGMSFDELYVMYVSKNVLNAFRQDHGYKEHKYIKIWNGVEDNGVLQILSSTLDPDSKDFQFDLYMLLEEAYSEITKK